MSGNWPASPSPPLSASQSAGAGGGPTEGWPTVCLTGMAALLKFLIMIKPIREGHPRN